MKLQFRKHIGIAIRPEYDDTYQETSKRKENQEKNEIQNYNTENLPKSAVRDIESEIA